MTNEVSTARGSSFVIDERDDDMLIAERHWQFGWRCLARRPKLVTNAEWRPDAERIVAALSAAKEPLAERPAVGREAVRCTLLAAMTGGPDGVALIDWMTDAVMPLIPASAADVRALLGEAIELIEHMPVGEFPGKSFNEKLATATGWLERARALNTHPDHSGYQGEAPASREGE